jgi:hypothetical protein
VGWEGRSKSVLRRRIRLTRAKRCNFPTSAPPPAAGCEQSAAADDRYEEDGADDDENCFHDGFKSGRSLPPTAPVALSARI